MVVTHCCRHIDGTLSKPAAKKTVADAKFKAHCGMIYSAADAKKYHYICPMNHKPLTKIAANVKSGKLPRQSSNIKPFSLCGK